MLTVKTPGGATWAKTPFVDVSDTPGPQGNVEDARAPHSASPLAFQPIWSCTEAVMLPVVLKARTNPVLEKVRGEAVRLNEDVA